jgi:tetratricopeptide (TPR) repeat protein
VGDSAAMVGASLLSVNLAERVSIGWQVPRSYSWLGYVVGLLRQHNLAGRYFARAHEGAERLDDPSEMAFALTVKAVYHIGFAHWEPAEESIKRALALSESDVQLHELALTVLGHIEFFTGRFEDSRRRYVELLASARARQNDQHTTWALFSIGRALCAMERFEEARPLLEDARERLQKKSELDSEIICLGLLALTHLRRGEAALARKLAEETLACVRRSRPGGFAVLGGYDAAIEVLLTLWERGAAGGRVDESLVRGALDMLGALTKLTRLFPLAGPANAFHAGRVERLRGHERQARRKFGEGARLADALGMPHERRRAILAANPS